MSNPSNPSNPSKPNSPENLSASGNLSVNEPAEPQPQTPAQERAISQGPTAGQQTGSQTNASQASLPPVEQEERPDQVTRASEESFPASDPPAY